jgi:hypothetical protein
MRGAVHERARGLAALVLLALFAALAGSFVHTDDGCEVEQHCRACRLAVAGLADHVPGAAHAVAPADLSAAGPAVDDQAPALSFGSSRSNRGPPATT